MPPTESKHYHWQFTGTRLEFYAQRGMITIIDEDAAADDTVDAHEAIKRVRPGEFMKRVIATRMAIGDKYPSEVKKANDLMDHAAEVCKIAKAQGDPGDEKVLEHHRKHNRKSSILLPGEANQMLGPVGGPKYRIQLSEPRDMMMNGVQVAPDFTVGPQDAITPAKAEQLRRAAAARR